MPLPSGEGTVPVDCAAAVMVACRLRFGGNATVAAGISGTELNVMVADWKDCVGGRLRQTSRVDGSAGLTMMGCPFMGAAGQAAPLTVAPAGMAVPVTVSPGATFAVDATVTTLAPAVSVATRLVPTPVTDSPAPT